MQFTVIFLTICGVAWSATNVTIPQLDECEWWGPEEMIGNEDTSIRPFQIEVADEVIEDLRYRLNNTIYQASLLGTGFTYGFNTRQLPSWINYWVNEYPFYERIKFLNSIPQYKTNIQGLDMHFLWVKPNVSSNIKVVPLLLLHGWPGSVREFYEAILRLTSTDNDYDFVFEVIVPSLPGFGFSDATQRSGLAPPQISVILLNLMRRLGHNKFYVQGGDFGSITASSLVTLFPQYILGHHTNFPFVLSTEILTKLAVGDFFPDAIAEPELQCRIYPIQDLLEFFTENFGYYHMQATRPDSIGVGLSDSPAGLLAYIVPHFIPFKHKELLALEDGGLNDIGISREKIIDNLMIYWINNCIGTAMRIYSEHSSKKTYNLGIDNISTTVPTWVMQARYELFFLPAKLLKTKYTNLIGTTILDYGDHFMALQHPDVFTEDVYKAVKQFIKFNSETSCSLN